MPLIKQLNYSCILQVSIQEQVIIVIMDQLYPEYFQHSGLQAVLHPRHLQKWPHITPQLATIYKDITAIYQQDPQACSLQDLVARLRSTLEILVYEPFPSEGSICRHKGAQDEKFVLCFDCSPTVTYCFCLGCFDKGSHPNHNFRTFDGKGSVCDCGSPSGIPRKHFCPTHRDFQPPTLTDTTPLVKFQDEMCFLLHLALSLKKDQSTQSLRRQILMLQWLHKIAPFVQQSYHYQKYTSEIFLQPFPPEYGLGGKSAGSLVLQQCWSTPVLRALAELWIPLYSYPPFQVVFTSQYWNFINNTERQHFYYDALKSMDEQFLEGKLFLALLQNERIRPLAVYNTFEVGDEELYRHVKIYQQYQHLKKFEEYDEVIKITLSRLSIVQFYNYSHNPKTVLEMKRQYMKFLFGAVKSLVKAEQGKKIISKMIGESWTNVISNKDGKYCNGKMTLGLTIFAYFGFDISKIQVMEEEELVDLFKVNDNRLKIEDIGSILEQLSCRFHDKIGQVPQKDLYHQRLYFSLGYVYEKCVLMLMKRAKELSSKELTSILTEDLPKKVQQQNKIVHKWVNKNQQTQQAAINRLVQQAMNRQRQEQGQQVHTDEQMLTLNTYSMSSSLSSLFFCTESPIPEAILADHFGRTDSPLILSFFKELTVMNTGKNKTEMKQLAEGWFNNPQLLWQFFTQHYDKCIKLKQIPQVEMSNLGSCNNLVGPSSMEETIIRLRWQLKHIPKGQNQWDWLVREDDINCFLLATKQILGLIMNAANMEKLTKEILSLGEQAIHCCITIYLHKPTEPYRQLLEHLATQFPFKKHLGNVLQSSFDVLAEHFAEKEQPTQEQIAEKQAEIHDKKERIKQAKLENMKKQQEKILHDHEHDLLEQEKEEQQNQEIETCIVCKQPSTQQNQLNFLCKLQFSNVLTGMVLSWRKPSLMVTTCQHKIHDKCLAEAIKGKQAFQAHYQCVLCKTNSNFRLPTSASSTEVLSQQFLSQLMTVIAIESQAIGLDPQTVATPGALPSLLFNCIVNGIYLLYLTDEKLYCSKVLPITQILINLTKQALKLSSLQPKPSYFRYNHQIMEVSNLVEELIDAKQDLITEAQTQKVYQILKSNQSQNNGLAIETELLAKLKLHLTGKPQKFGSYKSDRVPFPSLPSDLLDLNKYIGRCQSCSQLSSQLLLCFYCGHRFCKACKPTITNHLNQLHLGSGVLINVMNGMYYSQHKEQVAAEGSLYRNYVGEEWKEWKPPARGNYRLDTKRYEKLILSVMLDNVRDFVQKEKKEEQQCQVQ